MTTRLESEQLLAGATARHTVAIPKELLDRSADGDVRGEAASLGEVVLRPLTLRDVQLVTRAAKDEDALTSGLMVQRALVAPELSADEVGRLPAGLVQFLLAEVNRISGLGMDEDELDRSVRAPLAKACFVLAREFGWTPAQCAELTIGQVLLYLEMIARGSENGGAEE